MSKNTDPIYKGKLPFTNRKNDEWLEMIWRKMAYIEYEVLQGSGVAAELLESIMKQVEQKIERDGYH